MYFMRKISLSAIFIFVICIRTIIAQNLDLVVLRSLNSSNPSSQTYWIQTSNSVYWVPTTALMSGLSYGLLAKDKRVLRSTFESALGIGISVAVSSGIKQLVNRPRPSQSYPDEINSYTSSTGKSFPSGHTSLAFSTATVLSLQYKKWYVTVPAFAWAASVGYSRMALGRHYPSDVLCGAAVGVGSGYLGHWLTKKIFRH